MKQAEAIAKEKMKDLNAFDIKGQQKYLWFSRSMGIEVKGNYEKDVKKI